MTHIRTRGFDWVVTKAVDGWKPDCCPNFDPGLAHVVAHDVLEHLDDRQSFDGELRAFGVTMYGRMYAAPHRMYEASSSDLNVFLALQDYKVPKPPSNLANKPLDETGERMLRRLLRETEVNSASPGILRNNNDSRELRTDAEKFRSVVDDVRGWIRIGYRVAARRYKTLGHYGTDRLFTKLADAIVEDARENYPKPGDTLKISLDLDTFKFSLVRGQLSPEEVIKAEAAALKADPRHGQPRHDRHREIEDILRDIFGSAFAGL